MQSQAQFNRVPEKVSGGLGAEPGQVHQKDPEKVWELEKVWEALVQSQVRSNRVPKKVPEKVPEGFGAEPGWVQQGFEDGSGEGMGGFGAKPG